MHALPGTHRLRRFLLFVLLSAGCWQAAAYYPPYGYQQPGMYPPQYPDNNGAVQRQPYWYPYQQQVQPAPRYTPPRIETRVSDTAPYEQQSLVYSIRIISDGNVRSATPEVPQSSALVLRPLGEPLSIDGGRDKAREFVTEHRYLLMPLSSGPLEIPPARVTGHYQARDGSEGPAFNISGEPLSLQVRPATGAVQPWLPLYNLQITARLRGSESPAAGNPIELEVETHAVGATGSQIPSIADFIESKDFRLYPGKSVSEGNVSKDGSTLQGRRLETFTLVPRYGGWLQLPTAKVNWWNVRYNRPEVAALLSDHINVMGPANPQRDGQGGLFGSAFFWLPMVVALGILLFGWLSAFMGDGRLPGTDSIKRLFRPILGELYAPLVRFANHLTPRRRLHRLRTWTGRQLPVSWKLWFCLRAVSREDDPAEWAQALQILAAKHLGVRPQANLHQLGESIVRCHPRANAEAVDRLLGELDQAVYGDQPLRSFERWKREFRQQIKPGLLPIRFRQRARASRTSTELPELNPQ